MIHFLYSIDRAVFCLINETFANPVSDVIFPFFTHLTETWYGITLLAIAWCTLFIKGGKKGRAVALLIAPLVTLSDQTSSTLIKKLIMRPRPCHELNGVPFVAQIHLLVPCGSGYSFPSSHATNSFAIATFVSYYFKKARAGLFTLASAIALSRVVVGVHYPSDIIGGALLGMLIASVMIVCWNLFDRKVFAGALTGNQPAISNDHD